jgi:hypothetical protein
MCLSRLLKSWPIITTLVIIGLVTSFLLGMYVQGHWRHPTTSYVYIPNDQDQAKGVLIDFLASLHDKNYAKAASVYGGDYSTLKYWNPVVNPDDVTMLWQHGCELNGLQCLEIRNLAFASQPDTDAFVFQVWFSNPDKITEFKSASGATSFPFTVIKDKSGKFLVENMPVYVQ